MNPSSITTIEVLVIIAILSFFAFVMYSLNLFRPE